MQMHSSRRLRSRDSAHMCASSMHRSDANALVRVWFGWISKRKWGHNVERLQICAERVMLPRKQGIIKPNRARYRHRNVHSKGRTKETLNYLFERSNPFPFVALKPLNHIMCSLFTHIFISVFCLTFRLEPLHLFFHSLRPVRPAHSPAAGSG